MENAMSTRSSTDHHGDARMEIDLPSVFDESHRGLEPGSYTAEKLRHASASHVHMTNRRFFIGPIPKGWLQSHRKSWYKSRLKFRNYTSKAATFSADFPIARESRVSLPTDQPNISEQDGLDRAQQGYFDDHEAELPTNSLGSFHVPIAESQGASSSKLGAHGASTSDTESPTRESFSAKRDGTSAYFTAREYSTTPFHTGHVSSAKRSRAANLEESAEEQPKQRLSIPSPHDTDQSCLAAPTSDSGSTVPLLRSQPQNKGKGKQHNMSLTGLEQQNAPETDVDDIQNRRLLWQDHALPFSKLATKYPLDDQLLDKQQRILSRISKTQSKVPEWLRRRNVEEGEIVKAEKMLVRVDETMQEDLPDDYTEFDSLRMETRVQDNWREFLVVCRSTSDKKAPYTLQMYKTRVIPEIQKEGRKVSPHHEIFLGRRIAKVNLYSSLDKTIVIWNKSKRGTNIYILRPKSTAHAVEWYTFLIHTLGRRRPASLLINVPDLDISLVLRNPFGQLRASHETKSQDSEAISQSVIVEQFACSAITQRCMEMLKGRPEWAEVLKRWSSTERMGLAWRRYDRLEWVYGLNEEKMYGSLAMQGTHELELRPRQHYDTFISYGSKREEEPTPVEGFLIRLTSQKGVHQRMNRMFFKRLYFFCQDHYLFFCRPSHALPPAPLIYSRESDIPTTQEILDKMPLSYDIDPFPIQDGNISWLSSGNTANLKRHDEEAYAQLNRNIHNLTHSDGFINLCHVQEVRHILNNSPTEAGIQRDGQSTINASGTGNTSREDGAEGQNDNDVGFEILLHNGLIIRFQAYNSATRNEWVERLHALVSYWKARTAADVAELKAIRQRNLDILDIDEELESVIGQFAKKWEVKKAEASPLLHNMCSLSGCRPIKMSGLLYKKPRRHATFKRYHVVLTSGMLLIYHSSLRRRNGTEIPYIHHNLESTIELDNCYVYSGLLTESDLLYANQTFDSNHPGHRTLPRVYLSSDLYTSSDEDTAITFVIWQPLKKNLFRARELGEKGQTRQSLKQVSKLGVHGRTIVFKARSRVEKDRWVLSISSEIDQLQEGKPEEVRLISSH